MAYKCDTMEEIDATTDIVKHIIRESKLHIEVRTGLYTLPRRFLSDTRMF